MNSLWFLAALAGTLFAPLAEGLFYQLPPDGSWVRFEAPWTYRSGDQTLTGSQTLWMASVGEVTENGEPCRWIEFRLDAIENGVKKFWVRKLLIPVRYLRRGEDATAHVIRGWTLQEDRGVEPAVAVHPKAAFGVLATRMLFEVTGQGPAYSIDVSATLVASGTGAITELPEHK